LESTEFAREITKINYQTGNQDSCLETGGGSARVITATWANLELVFFDVV
jgi:hypothetical protein